MSKAIPKSEILKFDTQLEELTQETFNINDQMSEAVNTQSEQRKRQNDLMAEIDALAAKMNIIHEVHSPSAPMFSHLDIELEDLYNKQHSTIRRFPSLSPVEWIYASIAGIISTAIDIVFVGTPEVVKIYKGGEHFDGSRLTAALRQVGGDPESPAYAVFHWLSDKCKVSYDLSAVKGVMTPNNHRIRSLGHDPFFGLFFAVVDILLDTTTCIDNSGRLIIMKGNHQSDVKEKLLSVLYYIGHIFSDVCTARGIPVPGFFLTQFFTGGNSSDSIAKISERMYIDGYDLRHLVSTSVPVVVKNLLIDAYLVISKPESVTASSISEKEISRQQAALKKEKMIFISDCIATGGNLAKVLLPPSCGNPSSINLTQWAQFIKSCITMSSAAARDMSTETVIVQRNDIDATWEKLLGKDI